MFIHRATMHTMHTKPISPSGTCSRWPILLITQRLCQLQHSRNRSCAQAHISRAGVQSPGLDLCFLACFQIPKHRDYACNSRCYHKTFPSPCTAYERQSA